MDNSIIDDFHIVQSANNDLIEIEHTSFLRGNFMSLLAGALLFVLFTGLLFLTVGFRGSFEDIFFMILFIFPMLLGVYPYSMSVKSYKALKQKDSEVFRKAQKKLWAYFFFLSLFIIIILAFLGCFICYNISRL